MTADASSVSLGLRANWRQFSLLVLINAFVGGMVGLERTILPLLAAQDFGVVSKTAILSFLVSFGLVKAGANVFAGRLGDCFGRKRVLVLGWVVGLPVQDWHFPGLGCESRVTMPSWRPPRCSRSNLHGPWKGHLLPPRLRRCLRKHPGRIAPYSRCARQGW